MCACAQVLMHSEPKCTISGTVEFRQSDTGVSNCKRQHCDVFIAEYVEMAQVASGLNASVMITPR